MLSTIVFWYFNTIMAWAMYYVVASFREVVPWSLCGQWWNTPRCTDILSRALNDTVANSSSSFPNITMAWTNHTSEAMSGKSTDTQTKQYCQQTGVLTCSVTVLYLLYLIKLEEEKKKIYFIANKLYSPPPPLRLAYSFLSFFFLFHVFVIIVVVTVCVCGGGVCGGGGDLNSPKLLFFENRKMLQFRREDVQHPISPDAQTFCHALSTIQQPIARQVS